MPFVAGALAGGAALLVAKALAPRRGIDPALIRRIASGGSLPCAPSDANHFPYSGMYQLLPACGNSQAAAGERVPRDATAEARYWSWENDRRHSYSLIT